MTTPESGPRVVLYLRQSERQPGEDSRTSLSIRSQEDRGRQWVSMIGGTVVAVVRDHDLRGADPNRPGIRELLDTVKAQRVDALWVFALSRLVRDLMLQLMICRDLDKSVPWIHSDIEGDINDPFIRGIYGLMNEQATRQQSAHSRAAMERRARDGNFPTGPTPMGFVRPYRIHITRANGTSYERETGEPSIDETTAPRVRELFRRFADGESLHILTDELAREGSGPRGGQWTRRTLKRVLQSPIYAGDIVHKGVVVAHNAKWAIVDRQTWDRVQARMGRSVVIRRDVRDSWLEGIILHSCGKRMYYQRYTGKSEGHGGMFCCRSQHEPAVNRCQDDRRIMGASLAEQAVVTALIADLTRRRSSDDAMAFARELAGGMDAAKRRDRIEKELSDARARWQRMFDRFGDGKVSADDMDREDERWAEAQTRYDRSLGTLPSPPNAAAIEALSVHLEAIAALVPQYTGNEIRSLLDDLSASVTVSDDGVRITYGIDPHQHVIRSGLVRVPKWGKGVRAA